MTLNCVTAELAVFALFHRIWVALAASYVKMVEYRLYCLRQNCSPKNLVLSDYDTCK